MSKSENGAIVGQILKGIAGLVGAVTVAIFSAKKGTKEYRNWQGKRKPGK